MEFNTLWEAFLQALENEGFFYTSELLAVITGVIYVVLAARNNSWCWFWGIISAAFWTYAVGLIFGLYLDAFLQVFYIVMAVIGWWQWTKGTEEEQLRITKLSRSEHLIILASGSVLALLFGYLFDEYTPAAATYLDAFTTIFSMAATFMVVQRKLENWLYWIVIDALYVYLYFTRGAYLFALLFVVYVVIAAIGYWRWKKEMVSASEAV